MSFWGFVKDLAPIAISAGATLYGASQQSKAADSASQRAIAAQEQATAAQLEALARAEENTRRMQTAAAPGLAHVQQMIARGDQLTPAQIDALTEARRTTLDALQGGSVRGSAAATAAAVRDVEGKMRNQYLDINRQNVNSAAQQLANGYFNSGNTLSNLSLKGGDAVSQGLITAGGIDASNIYGQGAIKGQAIGNIGAVIADQFKNDDQKRRDSSYGTTVFVPSNKGTI